MHNKRLKNNIDLSEVLITGNRMIESFMGGYKYLLQNESNFYEPTNYNASWDLLMPVIKKIKNKVSQEGYDMFMSEHKSYISIGNACYDVDIEEAWRCVVLWIEVRMELQEEKLGTRDLHDPIVYKTSNKYTRPLKISSHAIKRYKQRIDYKKNIDEICEFLSTKELLNSYQNNGNGRYYIGNGLVVAIEDYKILTIYNSDEKADINSRIGNLSEQSFILKQYN